MDNGFGAKSNSADSLLRVFAIRLTFARRRAARARSPPVDFRRGTTLPSFTSDSYITLRDPDGKSWGFRSWRTGSLSRTPATVPVATAIRRDRLLTGADLDPESIRKDRNGHFWFGDEFGPFLVETDRNRRGTAAGGSRCQVSSRRRTLPGAVGRPTWAVARVRRSGHLLATAGRSSGLIEGTVAGDTPGRLRIHEFDVARRRFTEAAYGYVARPARNEIGDMTAVTDGCSSYRTERRRGRRRHTCAVQEDLSGGSRDDRRLLQRQEDRGRRPDAPGRPGDSTGTATRRSGSRSSRSRTSSLSTRRRCSSSTTTTIPGAEAAGHSPIPRRCC